MIKRERTLTQHNFNSTLSMRLKGKNLSQVAKEVGIPKTILHDWVRSKRLPAFRNLHHLVSLAHYFGISLEELLLGKQSSNSLLSSVLFKDDDRSYRIKIERLE